MNKRTPPGGFTLIEVLVALTILGLTLGSMFAAFQGGLRNIDAAEHYAWAAAIADSRLAEVGYEIPLEAGNEQRGTEGRFSWTVKVTPYRNAAVPDASDPSTDDAPPLYHVAVSVRWAQALVEREVTLETLRTGTRL